MRYLYLILFAPLFPHNIIAATVDPAGWKASRGSWTEVTSSSITASGNHDNRLIATSPAPPDFRWTVDVHLGSGWSAGLLLWATPDTQSGYAVRLDARQGQLILERTGPWPEVEKLDSFPWTPLDGPHIQLEVVAADGAIRVYNHAKSTYPILQTLQAKPAGHHLGLQLIDAEATFTTVSGPAPVDTTSTAPVAHVPEVGKFTHVYDPALGEPDNPWYINDHCFIRGTDAGWHLFGITHQHPGAPLDELNFAHAISTEFPGALQSWKKQPYALTADPAAGERHLWAPHVIKRGETYYMFYCAGSEHGGALYRIHLATSPDLKTWTRHPSNPIFQDTFDARDPMILEDKGIYYMYYTANMDRNKSHHTVNLRTSRDLLTWSPATIALRHPAMGTGAGPTESPYVVKYGSHFYLFIGPAGDYHRTAVFRSPNPIHWNHSSEITTFPSHAAEVVQDDQGNYFASDSGWDLRGVYLAPLKWLEEKGSKME